MIPNRTINTTVVDNQFELNKFVISQVTIEAGDGSAVELITCRPIIIDLEVGDKILINQQKFTVYTRAIVGATSIYVDPITTEQTIDVGGKIVLDQENLFVQYQRKSEGTVGGFNIDSDGIEKDGIEINGWLDSDTMTGASVNTVPTSESVKAYVDANSVRSNYLFGTCSGTGLTSVTDGIANAVVVPYDSTSVSSSGTSITLYGAGGVVGVSDSEYSFLLDENSEIGTYEIKWNVSTNTDTVNNRYLCGVALQSGLAEDTSVTWETLSPSHTWLYNRGTGGNREASGSNSMLYDLEAGEYNRIFRIVFWKEDGNASGKLITTTNGCGLTIKEL